MTDVVATAGKVLPKSGQTTRFSRPADGGPNAFGMICLLCCFPAVGSMHGLNVAVVLAGLPVSFRAL